MKTEEAEVEEEEELLSGAELGGKGEEVQTFLTLLSSHCTGRSNKCQTPQLLLSCPAYIMACADKQPQLIRLVHSSKVSK